MTMPEGSELTVLRSRLLPYMSMLQQAVDTVVDQDVSKYPIVVLQDGRLEIGITLYQSDPLCLNISTLEEFVARQIIPEDKVDSFREVYAQATHQICLLDYMSESAGWVFIPRTDRDMNPARAN